MSRAIIRVENLGKRYRIGLRQPPARNSGEQVRALITAPFQYLLQMTRPPTEAETLWALRGVSFEVERGQVVGIIGRNGAGKSTLLKILSRITEPTEGRAEIHGRVGSLLEVGTGFHPDLTGRENIYMNGAILGMKKREIDGKFDQMVEFAEIERFLDTPVKRYSSGMYVRLAFAVAAHLEPEILIVDEVLAVGDAAFQKKCLGKMEDVAGEGRTVLFVSHKTLAVQTLCPRTLWIDGGQLVADGETDEVIARYLEQLESTAAHGSLLQSMDGDVRIEQVRLLNADQKDAVAFEPGEPLTVELEYVARRPIPQPYFWVGVTGHVGHLFAANMQLDGFRPARLDGRGRIRCTFHALPLLPHQDYIVRMGALEQDGRTTLIAKSEIAHFRVTGTVDALGFEAEEADRAASTAASVLVPYAWDLGDGRTWSVDALKTRADRSQNRRSSL